MSWFKVDDKFSSSRKLMRVPRPIRLEAAGLWVIAGSWSAGHELDGLVPDYMVEEWGGRPEIVDALIAADLWERADVDDASRFVNWDEYQPTAEQQEERRRADRERKAEWRASRKAKNGHGNVRVESRRDTGVTDCDTSEGPSRPAGVTSKDAGTRVGFQLDNRVTDAPVTPVSQRDNVNPQVAVDMSHRDNRVTGTSVTSTSGRSPLYPDPTRPDPLKEGGYVSRDVTTRAYPTSPLPGRCRQHEYEPTPPPCGACADARRAAEAADRDHAAHAAERRAAEREQLAAATRAEIDSCGLCDDTGYRSGRVCDHDPTADERNRRGIELARSVLNQKDPDA
ncbi:hypothetical protein SEA_FINKLE_63 [Gordonia phage Finkle]|uniref:Helix-turn-helix DNA binding domain protein n=1 Tax=Gordonia phage Finkle TaxID=2926099 RepID=A0A9E7T0T3_9CAUD|nr:hypothetical protein QEH33_gp63 [Gordonia phage Finkle]UTN92977.1 hypothetical protein SEA_FINKLE_63 [Gordonia phage Finkle]